LPGFGKAPLCAGAVLPRPDADAAYNEAEDSPACKFGSLPTWRSSTISSSKRLLEINSEK